MKRRDLLKRVGHRYSKFMIFEKNECSYCGRDTNGQDHVPALINSYCYHPDVPHLLVPCCVRCNSTLGDKELHTLKDRAKHLYEIYEKKFSSILDLYWWEDEEIEEINGILKDDIKRIEGDRTWVEYMLNHLDLLIMHLNINGEDIKETQSMEYSEHD